MIEKGYKGLKVYQLAFQAAMKIYKVSTVFPKEEKYSLTDQIRRSSRSVCANIAEGYRKRIYPKFFLLKLADSDGECSETLVWLDFARECGFLNPERFEELSILYEEIGRLLGKMIQNPEKFQYPPTACCLLPTVYCLLPTAYNSNVHFNIDPNRFLCNFAAVF